MAEMTKEEAAAFMGCSKRQFERYQSAGKIKPSYKEKGNSVQAYYQEVDLKALKTLLAQEAKDRLNGIKPPAVVKSPPPPSLLASPDIQEGLSGLLRALRSSVPIADKPILSLHEAQALTGLSRGFLREAIEKKTLKAKVLGRGFKVKRADLDSFIAKL